MDIVMVSWATVSIALGPAAIAVLGTLGAARMQLRHSTREREAAERQRWREKGAEVIEPLDSLLEEAEPLRMGLTLETWRDRWLDLWRRWPPLRAQLTVFAVANPSMAVGRIVGELTEAVPKALSDAGWFLGTFEGRRASRREDAMAQARAAAEASHKRAEDLTLMLLGDSLLRGEPGKKRGAAGGRRWLIAGASAAGPDSHRA
jgi:hypothetical protein